MALQRLHLIQQVLVVGGGVSGLLSALFSAQRGAPRVLLFEAGSWWGHHALLVRTGQTSSNTSIHSITMTIRIDYSNVLKKNIMRIGTMGYANSKYFNDNTVP